MGSQSKRPAPFLLNLSEELKYPEKCPFIPPGWYSTGQAVMHNDVPWCAGAATGINQEQMMLHYYSLIIAPFC